MKHDDLAAKPADSGAAPSAPETPAEAGRKGGETVRERYGTEFYGEIGRKGGSTTKRRHGPEHYAEIGRRGGKTTSARHGSDFYHTIGRKGGQRVKELIERGKQTDEAAE